MTRRRTGLALACVATAALSFLTIQYAMGPSPIATVQVLWSALFTQWVWVLLAFAVAAWLPGSIRTRLGFRSGTMPWVALVLATIGMLCLSNGVSLWLVALDVRETGTLAQLDEVVVGAREVAPWLPLLAIGLAPGFGEEILFRGLIQRTLATRMRSWGAVVVAAAFFGLVHLDPVHSPAAFVLGLYLGTVGVVAGNVWAPILCHATNNLLGVAGGSLSAPASGIGTTGSAAVWVVASAVLLAGSIWWTRRRAAAPATGSPDSPRGPDPDAVDSEDR
jgi:membrane protease YdiL (CAAX protease family)